MGERRSISEVAAFAGLVLSYMWGWQGAFPGSLWAVILAGLLFCAASNLAHRDPPRALGLRLDNLPAAAAEVGAATAAAALLLAGAGWLLGTLRPGAPVAAGRLPWLFFWALVQQYALQCFVLRRLREVYSDARSAALAAALVFALLHLPNPPLAAACLVIGYLWCRLFTRHPNLFTVALSHTILAVVMAHSFPRAWLHGMRVGPGYFNF